MLNIEEYEDLLATSSQRDFLNLMEACLRANFITRYMYVRLPADVQFNPEMVEIYQYGYEKIPEILQRISTFLRTPDGARSTKYSISSMLQPFLGTNALLKESSIKAKGTLVDKLTQTEDSLYIPVHAGGSQTGLFFLKGKKETVSLLNNQRSYQAFCQMLHQRYCELSISNRPIKFTSREREIINWMAQGKSNAVIGKILNISKHTVDAHLRAVFFKLTVTNRTAAAVKASQLGLLQH